MGNVEPLPGNRLGKVPSAGPGSGAEREMSESVSALLRSTLDLMAEYEELGEAIRVADEAPSLSIKDRSNRFRYANLGKQIQAAVTALAKLRPSTIDERTALLEVIERTACFYTESREFTALIRAAHAEIMAGGTLPSRPPRRFGTERLRRLFGFWRRWRHRPVQKQSD